VLYKLDLATLVHGYAQITSYFTTTSTPPVQIPGLSVTVTVPSGGARLEIIGYARACYVNTPSSAVRTSLWSGAVGSGTELTEFLNYGANGGAVNGLSLRYEGTFSAGTYTFNLGASAPAGWTYTLESAATYPAYMSVKQIAG